jgi:mRNA interferase MazF
VVEIERRGDIWVARLNPNRDGEIGKVRPVVVIQSDALSAAGLATVLVVPLTTQHRPGSEALRVRIVARGRLRRDCWAMVEQVHALDPSRFGEGPLATLTADEIAALERALKAALGMW